MHGSPDRLFAPAALALALMGCTDGGLVPPPCESEDLRDCFNIDFQIDGEDEENPVNSEDAQMCMAADGRLYVAWIDDRKAFKDVWFNASTDGGRTWFPSPIQIKNGDGDASGLDLECVGDRVFVAWEDTRDGATDYENIYFNYSTDGGVNWQAQDIPIDDDPDGRSISLGPKIAVFQGSVHIVWFDQSDGAPDIYVSSSQNGGRQFREPIIIPRENLEPGDAWAGNPQVEVGRGGLLHIVWEDTRWRTQDIYHTVSNANWDAFPTQTRLTRGEQRGTTFGFAPSLSVAGDNVYTVWHDTRAGQSRDIFMNCSTDAGTSFLAAAARVETDPPGSAESLNAKVIAEGSDGHIVWQDNTTGGYDIYYRKAEACAFPTDEDGEVIEPTRLDNGDPPGDGNSINPQLVLQEGTIAVAWEDRRAGGDSGLNELYYNFSSLDDEGEREDFVEDEDFRLDSIELATKYTESLNVEVFGNEIYAAWVDNRDGNDDLDIYFSHSALGEGVDTFEDIVAASGQEGAGGTPAE